MIIDFLFDLKDFLDLTVDLGVSFCLNFPNSLSFLGVLMGECFTLDFYMSLF